MKNHENHKSFFPGFLAENVFSGHDPMWFVWGGVGQALMQCLLFSAILLCYTGHLGDPVVPTLRGASKDVVTVYAY